MPIHGDWIHTFSHFVKIELIDLAWVAYKSAHQRKSSSIKTPMLTHWSIYTLWFWTRCRHRTRTLSLGQNRKYTFAFPVAWINRAKFRMVWSFLVITRAVHVQYELHLNISHSIVKSSSRSNTGPSLMSLTQTFPDPEDLGKHGVPCWTRIKEPTSKHLHLAPLISKDQKDTSTPVLTIGTPRINHLHSVAWSSLDRKVRDTHGPRIPRE